MESVIYFREANSEDKSFIYNSYLKSQRQYFNLKNTEYFPIMHDRLDNFFKKGCTGVVAVDSSNPNIIIGYTLIINTEDKCIILFCYVKQMFRKNNIATAMLKAIKEVTNKPLVAVDKTLSFEKLMLIFNIQYNPFILEGV